MAAPTTQIVIRGTTVQFSTNFFDVNGAKVQPDDATINIVYASVAAGAGQTLSVPMVPPAGSVTTWTALIDTRGWASPQTVFWSIHTGMNDPIPVAAEDGNFNLQANAANLPTF
jgi:hypothetical protein